MKFDKNTTSVVALGGLGEVGKNMYLICHDDEIVIIDAGVMFPNDELLGIDYVIQDITFLKLNESKIKALFITHGHEDHIGGITFLLQSIQVPVIYASKLAIDMIKKKLEDRDMYYNNLVTIDDDTKITTKHFNIEFIRTTHSIPDSYGVVIKSPQGTIVSTGDFKFDMTPIGPIADIHKMARLGDEGVRLLMSDSTNAMVPGLTNSESVVDEALNDIFAKHLGRIILATFASNIYRIKHIVDTCRENNRKIIIFGRSMENNIEIALENGILDDRSIFIDPNKAKDMKQNEICILCTGSQGEPLAALSRIANGIDKKISLLPNDLVVFSSSPIPGNAASINRIINKLYLRGVRVYTNTELADIHTSGHAKEEELKLMLRIIKPEYFMPMHGEYRMLKAHADLAHLCGVDNDKTFVMQNGDVLNLTNDKVERGSSVQAGDVYVDGSRVGNVGSVVIKDRKLMSKDGIIMVILNIDIDKLELLIKPNIASRGYVLVNENNELISKLERKAEEISKKILNQGNYNYINFKNQMILELHPYVYELSGKRPIILPVIMEIKK